MTTVLVTGGLGYIGSHTVLALLAAGHRCVIVDNLDNSSRQVLDRVREIAELDRSDERLRLHVVDLRDAGALDDCVGDAGVGACVHFAGRKSVRESVAEPLAYFDHNVTGSMNLLRSLERHGVWRVVFSSSATVYGEPASIPVAESAALRPINPYGRSKLMVEQILDDVAATDDRWRVLSLRYFNPVGAHPSGRIGESPVGTPENLMPYVMQVAAGTREQLSVFGDDYDTPDGTCIRDYIHVLDLADAHVAAIDALDRHPGCRAINVGTGVGTSVLELVAAAERAIGAPVPRTVVGRRPGDAARAYADTTLAREVLRWEPTRTVDDMCADHWRWQSRNPDGYGRGEQS